jgi:protein Tex
LVHVSEIAHKYITDPGEVLKLNDKVMVKVMEVDLPRKRIALSIKQTQETPTRNQRPAKSKHQNSPRQKETETASMEDAISLLRKKFGK